MAAPLEWVEAVSDLRLPPSAHTRVQQLMDRHTDGLLPEAERGEWEALVERRETLALVRAKALP